jgi:hypothetical protein
MMAVINDLFSNGMREILRSRIGLYPVYVFCFNDILNKGLLIGLESGSLFSRSSAASGSSVNPRLRKIRPYLINLLRRRSAVQKTGIMYVSRFRSMGVDEAKRVRTDYLFDPVINEICKNPPPLGMALVCVGGQGKHYTDDRVKNFSLFDFLSLRLLLKSLFGSGLLYLKYRRLAKRLSNTQKEIFGGFFTLPSLLFSHLLDFCLDRAIRDLDPKVIVANDDVLVFKPFTRTSPKLIVLQSASVREQLERHRYLLFSRFLDDGLLSEFFCASGSQSMSLKERFLKDTRKIVVTGQPRFDSLAKANEFFDKDEICKKLGLTTSKKILLWATDSGLREEESKENISAVYQAASALENVQLAIKLHPAEDQEAPLYKQNHSYAPIIIKGKQPISELLYACDAMVTKASTTANEAAILNKPIVVLNLSGEPDAMPYVEKGIALGVYKKEDLVSAIKDALYNGKIREKLAEGREKFVYEYAYVQDGKASERVANLIMQAMRDSAYVGKTEMLM